MTQEGIIEQLQEYLDQHLKGMRGAVSQEPYRGDFFKLFKEAYHNNYFDDSSGPILTADALTGVLCTRWYTEDQELNEKKELLMDQLFSKWYEWRYAWDHYE